jgi:hypothetical protein
MHLDTPVKESTLMQEVEVGFGGSLSCLPAVFGVSRQTLYHWLDGDAPREQHKEIIAQLAAAARVFTETGFKPTAQALDRTIIHGRSFLELIGNGASGKDTAERLIRIERHGAEARRRMEELLGERHRTRLAVADMGRPALDEDT